MSDRDVEKSSLTYRNAPGDAHHHGNLGADASALPAGTFVHNTASQLRILANPGPLGLYSFATTTFVLSMYNVSARGITVGNAVLGLAVAFGGLAQFCAGMWEFASGNTFGATAFTSYGAFWLSYAAFLIPGSGVADAYAAAPGQEPSAIGIYLASWGILTFLFMLATLRINLALVLLFFFLDLTFWLLMAGEFSGSATVHKAGGVVGLITAAVAYYAATAQLLTKETAIFTLPVWPLNRHRD